MWFDIRRDIYGDLYLFRFFSLLRTNTYELIPSAALSAVRFYKKSPDAADAFPVELPIALLLQKTKNINAPDVRVSVIKEMKNIVQKYLNGLRGVRGFQEHYTRYLIWCDALLADKPFYEQAGEWYKKFKSNK